MDDHLNDAYFARLAATIPAKKKQIVEKFKERKMAGNGQLKQPPCCICGKMFGSKLKDFSLAPPKPKPACPACQKHLDDGGTAMVNIASTRYALIVLKGEEFSEAFRQRFAEFADCKPADLSGRVKIVSDEFLDLIEAQKAKES